MQYLTGIRVTLRNPTSPDVFGAHVRLVPKPPEAGNVAGGRSGARDGAWSPPAIVKGA